MFRPAQRAWPSESGSHHGIWLHGSLPFLQTRRTCLCRKLPEVIIHVDLQEFAPFFGCHAAEHAMGLPIACAARTPRNIEDLR